MNRDNDLLRVTQEYFERTEREQRLNRWLEGALSIGAFFAVVALLFVALHLDVIPR